MRGKNPIRKPEQGDGTKLKIQKIFVTFQGEGPNAGVPAVFVRLGGCNLNCDFCDAEFEDFHEMDVTDIINEIITSANNEKGARTRNLVVITGGEPLRQPIELLCKNLLKEGFKVQIETNGTLFRDLDKRVEIVCSPKNTGKGYKKIREDLLPKITAFKFVVSNSDELYRDVKDVGQEKHNIPVYVQPLDEYDTKKNEENLVLARKFVDERGYNLSIQLQKIAGVP